MKHVEIDYIPQEKQQLLHDTAANQILYGGAAGGGKSRAARWDAVIWCVEIPGIEMYLFRRTYSELEDNHIRPLLRELPKDIYTYRPSQNVFEFVNGAKIILCHCNDTSDYLRYMGAEMHGLYVDEASLFEPIQLIELRGRVRLGSFATQIPKDLQAYFPRCVFTSNPGGPSHSFLQRTFINPAPERTIFYDQTMKDPADPDHKGWTTVYIKAKMVDNKYLDKNYGSVFSAMGPERAKALRDGDWDAIEGSAMHLLDRQRHMVREFIPPSHWTIFFSIDWGTAKPFSIGWYCVAGEDTIVKHNKHLTRTYKNPDQSVFLPRGAIIRFQEYYGWTGKDNEGVRLPSNVVARNILEREKELKIRRPDYRVADSAMWSQTDGPSPAEKMMTASDNVIILQKCKKGRADNYDEINARLAGNPLVKEDGIIEDTPLLFITENCVQAWRTLPTLLLDKVHPDKGPDSNGEDHVFDDLAYALASRPLIMSKEDRDEVEYYKKGHSSRKSMDRYATA